MASSDSEEDDGFGRNETAKERIDRRKRSRRKKTSSSSIEVTALLLFLLGGLIFCMLDVVYISNYISIQQFKNRISSRISTANTSRRTNHIQTLATNWNESSIRNLVHDALGSKAGEQENLQHLPTADEVASLYGSEPRVWGLDTCAAFQASGVDPANHFITTAGTFNTGTNLMAELLIANCYMPKRREKFQQDGVRWQAVWGKHTPIWNDTARLTHRTYNDSLVQAEAMFPVVTIRDPYQWLQSLCRLPYAFEWKFDKDHCPNLASSDTEVTIHYAAFTQKHASVVQFYNEFYSDYMEAKFPRVIVRMEDLMFHPVSVTKAVCECAGGRLKSYDKFKYVAYKNSYTDALIKYGTEATRYKRLSKADLDFAKAHLDPQLMEWFGYKYAPIAAEAEEQQQQ